MRIVIVCVLVVSALLSSCATKRKVVVPPISSLTPWRNYGETLKEVCSPGYPVNLDGVPGISFKLGCIRALAELGYFNTVRLWVDDPEFLVSYEAKKALEEVKKK